MSKELKNSRTANSLQVDIDMENIHRCISINGPRRNLYDKRSNEAKKEVILFFNDDDVSACNIDEQQRENDDILLLIEDDESELPPNKSQCILNNCIYHQKEKRSNESLDDLGTSNLHVIAAEENYRSSKLLV